MRTPLQERIVTLAKNKGISVSELERRLNLSHGLMMKRNNPSADNCTEILAMFPDVSAEWLMRGEGGMMKDEHECGNVFKFGSNNRNNFSPDSTNGSDNEKTIATLLQIIQEKDRRINQLTDKLIENNK